jgi:hypothetical protein
MAATTPRKKPAAKTPARSARPAPKPGKYRVEDETFIADTADGELRIPLRFKTKLMRVIRDLDGELDQVFALLDGIGDTETAEALDELDIFESLDLVTEYFAAWEAKHQATVGEAKRSSN